MNKYNWVARETHTSHDATKELDARKTFRCVKYLGYNKSIDGGTYIRTERTKPFLNICFFLWIHIFRAH